MLKAFSGSRMPDAGKRFHQKGIYGRMVCSVFFRGFREEWPLSVVSILENYAEDLYLL